MTQDVRRQLKQVVCALMATDLGFHFTVRLNLLFSISLTETLLQRCKVRQGTGERTPKFTLQKQTTSCPKPELSFKGMFLSHGALHTALGSTLGAQPRDYKNQLYIGVTPTLSVKIQGKNIVCFNT